MIVEIIIIICLVIIFILIVRRLPNVMPKPVRNIAPKMIPDNKSDFDIADDFFGQNNYPEAEKYYLKAATHDPDNPKIYNRLGIIYLEQKNYRDAKDAFEVALKLDSKKASRHINYGLACLNMKNFEEAIKSFEKAIQLEPKNKKYQGLFKDAQAKKKLVEKE